MICPGCKNEITCSTIEQIAQRYQCEDCGYIGILEEKKEGIKYPNTNLGFILFAIYFVVTIVLVASPSNNPESALTIFYLFTLGLFVVYLYYIFLFHSILNDLTDNRYPISASRSVWGHFIPIYNIIFIFTWPNAFADYYNENHRSKRLVKFAGGLIILVAMIINYTIGFGVLILFGLITYYNIKLKDLVDTEIERLKSLPLTSVAEI